MQELVKIVENQVDGVLFSPPFVNSNEGAGLQSRRLKGELTKKDIRMGNCIKKISNDKNNIDNIKKYGEVDHIVTSPPFGNSEASLHKSKFKNPEKFAEISSKRFKTGEKKGHYASKEAILKSMDALDKEYSKDKNNVGNKSGKSYLSEMKKIYDQCFQVLKHHGYMILVLKNFVKSGKQIRLDLDTIKLCESSGFKFFKRHYRKIKNPSFWITNAIQKWEKKYPDKPHPYPLEEDILVFIKTDGNGKIDGVVFSPSFADRNQSKGHFLNHENSCGGGI